MIKRTVSGPKKRTKPSIKSIPTGTPPGRSGPARAGRGGAYGETVAEAAKRRRQSRPRSSGG